MNDMTLLEIKNLLLDCKEKIELFSAANGHKYVGGKEATQNLYPRIERATITLQALRVAVEPAVSDAVIQALIEAKDLAMHNTLAARIPECGYFGKIAQNLDYALQELQAATTKNTQ